MGSCHGARPCRNPVSSNVRMTLCDPREQWLREPPSVACGRQGVTWCGVTSTPSRRLRADDVRVLGTSR